MNMKSIFRGVVPVLISLAVWELFLKDTITGFGIGGGGG